MSKRRKSKRKNNNTLGKILRKIRQVTWNTSRRAVRGLVRDVMALKRHRLPQAGFVLPTVTMVMLVVILLTIAISLRSFDRADQARNVRANQQLINAATPALDRARAKLYELLAGGDRTAGTPDDDSIYSTLTSQVFADTDGDDEADTWIDKYTFNDETRIKVRYDRDGDRSIDQEGADEESDPDVFDDEQEMMLAAWKFEVDADNDGAADSDTIYGIFFKSPAADSARTPLEARTPPMVFEETAGSSDPLCQALNSSTGLGGGTGWESRSGNLMKSFFVYIANVPRNGSGGVSVLEYQQDWTRIPASTNAIRYEGDLEIAPGPTFNLNGRIQSLGNMIISPSGDDDINLYLISAPESCYYTEDNNQITVGGHLINGLVGSETDPDTASSIFVHLMNGGTEDPDEDVTLVGAESTTASSKQVYYDEAIYEERLKELVALVDDTGTEIPASVQEEIDEGESRENALLTYFSSLVRKVPMAEDECAFDCTAIDGGGETLRPAESKEDILIKPEEGVTNIPIQYLPATDPEITESNPLKHFHIGDRVLVGHNLPSQWWDEDAEEFVTEEELTDEYWLNEDGDITENLRVRKTQVGSVPSVGAKNRDGLWERTAAMEVDEPLSGEGGLRVITGAGIYDRDESFLPPPFPETMYDGRFEVVWPDTMPMSPVPGSRVYDNDGERWIDEDDAAAKDKGDLQMRASVVYHYAHDWGKKVEGEALEPQEPVACVSSYYDPSTEETAKNEDGLPWEADAAGKSNNGIVYAFPADGEGAASTDPDYSTYEDKLKEQQALMVYPDGRFVNELLYKAYYDEDDEPGTPNKDASTRTLAEQAAVDAGVCALSILEGATPDATLGLPNGAISEIAFLDTRQVKGLDDDDPTTDTVDESFQLSSETTFTKSDNKLPLEERQPLEIRATQLDLNLLRNASVTVEVADFEGPTPEYFLPNTGIIYASRDDALADISAVLKTIGDNPDVVADIESPYDIDEIKDDPSLETTSDNDLLLDPTRRPNGIMLINGQKLARNDSNNDGHNDTTVTSLDDISKEKGLVLVSNDPVYIFGEFNPHEHEEFNDELTDDWSNFYSRGDSELNVNFACRPGDPRLTGCTEGDSWRSAKVIADAITAMSDEWRPGYRNEGDFDLRSNERDGGTVTLNKDSEDEVPEYRYRRLFNGFFANDYAINGLSADWSFPDSADDTYRLRDEDYSGASADAVNSSYFNNFQTPVQRRTTTDYPEYLMEMCRKVPVSECTPEDWVVGYDLNNDGDGEDAVDAGGLTLDVNEDGVVDTDDIESDIKAYHFRDSSGALRISGYRIQQLISGSTRYLGGTAGDMQKDNQRYPHRVAFKRNAYGQLELEDTTLVPIPMGMGENNREPDEYPYSKYASGSLKSQNDEPIMAKRRALWFKTTNDKNDPSNPSEDEMTYRSDRPLFYLDPTNLSADSPYSLFADTEIDPTNWLLPDAPAVNDISGGDLGDGSDYAVCVDGLEQIERGDAVYDVDDALAVGSPDTTCASLLAGGDIEIFRDYLLNTIEEDTAPTSPWDIDGNLSLDAIASTSSTDDDIEDDNASGADGVLVYDIPNPNSTIGDSAEVRTITLAGNSNTIFVLKRSGDISFDLGGVRLLLKGGVNPNNIFWVVNGDVTFENASTTAPKAPHQLTGNFIGSGDLDIGDNTNLLGVRLLGFSSVATLPTGDYTVTATSSQAQPLLVPVLQIHQPIGSASANTDSMPSGNTDKAANDTKWIPRAESTTYNLIFSGGDVPSDPDENLTNGGVQNIVRFMENWKKDNKRNEIQGAFMQSGRSKFATAPLQQAEGKPDTGSATPSHLFEYPMMYYMGTGDRKHGIFAAPNRVWGYDVGLLSQPMDQFDLQLSDPVDEPDEYFREISRDDAWAKALLCAVETVEDDVTADGPPVASNFNNDDSDFCDGYR